MGNRKHRKHTSRKIIMLNILLAVFLLMGIAYSALSTNLNLSGSIKVEKYNTLYNVLKQAAEEGTYAREYKYRHQDSMNPALSTKKIYYWNAENEAEGNTIRDMNNVIFGNTCWQMIRTTDTGGVRLLYNGEPANNQCLYDRGYHIASIKEIKRQSTFYSDYSYYATGYSYNPETGNFTLTGDITYEKWDPNNMDNLMNKYTFFWRQNNRNEKILYQVKGYIDHDYARVLSYHSDVYSSVGVDRFRIEATDYVSYMANRPFGDLHNTDMRPETITLYQSSGYSYNYFYSDTYTYDENTGYYNLTGDVFQIENEDYSSIIGKYTLMNNDPENQPAEKYIYYVVSADEDIYYYYSLTDNNPPDSGTQYYFFSEYTDNGDGTYSIINPTVLNRKTYMANYTERNGNYLCMDAVNNTCSELFYITQAYPDRFSYISLDHNYMYATDFYYENGEYHLTGDTMTTLNLAENQSELGTKRYTCWDLDGTCTEMAYILSYDAWGGPRYAKLENGQDIDDYLYDRLYADDVNKNSTVLKDLVDLWYSNNMIEYSSYIDDTIYCGNRSIIYKSSWGGNTSLTPYLRFGDCPGWASSLYCSYETDRYSISNPKAQLTYPTAIMTASEASLLGYSSARKSPSDYYLLSPASYINALSISSVSSDGGIGYNRSGNLSARPVISLKKGTSYISGTGSMEDPYIVDAPPITG